MKSLVAFSIVAIAIGILSDESAGQTPLDRTGTGTTSGTASKAAPAASATPDEESNTDENDDTLYHGRTNETENPMHMGEGPLHFKTHPKEKIQEVDSLKKLQSSGSDPKFQGSLLHSSVTSIDDIAAKATENRDEANNVDPRFKAKRLTFPPQKNDEPVKAKSDSSPSPTPSPTASPAAKNSSDQKK